MKTIGFHSNQLGNRGTEVALYDYALYNEELLGNKSYIISDANCNNLVTLDKFKNRFEVFLYNSFDECKSLVKQKNIDSVYYIKAGDFDGKIIPGVANLIHTVFQSNQVHGDKYSYVSSWLANEMKMPGNYVPHIVSMPAPSRNFREKLNISSNQIVIGRYGGYDQFDLPFVFAAIYEVLKKRDDIVFLFMDTMPFGTEHKNIIFVEGTNSVQHKSNFINTCDYMIHARSHGESFGLSICEFLFHNKPIISWYGGIDLNHIEILKNYGLWYIDYDSIYDILSCIPPNNLNNNLYKNLVTEFQPVNVMRRFKTVFLD